MGEKLRSFPFMEKRRIYYIVTLVLIIVSIGVGFARGYNLGIDFTGGTLMQLEMGQEVDLSEINSILSDQSIEGNVVHAGEGNTQIIIKTTDSLESETRTALMTALAEKYSITEDDAVISVENIGPSVGETLKTSAFKAVLVAVILMLIYIAVRFMWKYGIAAIAALLNTLLLVFGFYGLFHITINSPFIAAMLTILGYGINDTIVIFDRIRENTESSSKRSVNGLAPLVDESIRQTVGRSIMTSLTTIAVMIPLLIFCGDTIRSFILPLLVGVICSTCSSIFIATSVWYDIMKISDKSSYQGKSKNKNKKKAAGETA
jgi:SecD/SecF fusion protein